ncbi:MAG: acyl-CoA dehydrogenase [Deltaproteobacteria bacterium]|nr:acyl-CoA dehydrogenase [Deltaproteobacteria bacterium]
MANPLIDDRTLDFLLYDVLDTEALVRFPRFEMHNKESFTLALRTVAKLARESLFPTLRKMDQEPPVLKDGRVHTHPDLPRVVGQMVEQGYVAMARPIEVGGMQMPLTIASAIGAYLDAGNVGAACYVGLSGGAAHLIESFGSDELKKTYMQPMYEGRWTGTMALTEPHAGSSLADVRTKATPTGKGDYLVQGEKVFISGGDNSFSENIVHLTLARIDGAPAGTKGVSLFVIPKRRVEGGKLVDNDCKPSGLFHKMGWKGLPSIALKFGEDNACHGYLVGKANEGLRCMFQMMNGARLNVGMAAAANASVAYHEALAYAQNRPQGRAMTNRDASTPQVPIIEHMDVRRMLLAQKAIVEGCLALLLTCARYSDVADASPDEEARAKAQKLLDLLTPIAKSFPAEKGFEANALAVQVHGGYGYTAEYLPELLLREQKLNTLHEGTTGIQSLDLLGRKIFGDMGLSIGLLGEEMRQDIAQAEKLPRTKKHAGALGEALDGWTVLLATLGTRAQSGDVDGALATSVWHLELASTIVVAWLWLRMAHIAAKKPSSPFYEGKLRAADYWFETELPRAAELCRRVEMPTPAYRSMPIDAF